MFQQQLRVVQPASSNPGTRDWQKHRFANRDELVAYTYSSQESDSPSFQFVHSIVNRVATAAEKESARDTYAPVDRTRRLATQPEIFQFCLPWTNAPYGTMSGCPSTTREIKMGVAHDTGYTKALTGYGTTGISAQDAIDRVEEDAIMNNNILNVLIGTTYVSPCPSRKRLV